MKERNCYSVLHWLKARKDEVFHAYRSHTPGTATVCGGGAEILNLMDMDTGSSRSKCCLDCFIKIYKVPSLAATKHKGEAANE